MPKVAAAPALEMALNGVISPADPWVKGNWRSGVKLPGPVLPLAPWAPTISGARPMAWSRIGLTRKALELPAVPAVPPPAPPPVVAPPVVPAATSSCCC